jgi:hypothetical protein
MDGTSFCSQRGSVEKQTTAAAPIWWVHPCLLRILIAIGCLAFLQGSGAWQDFREQGILKALAVILEAHACFVGSLGLSFLPNTPF